MTDLKKTLGPLKGAGLMLNIVIGAGLLSLPGLAYQQAAENAIWVWALCALVALPLLSVFIIMGARFPDAGGVSSFAQKAFGRYAYIASSFIFLGAVSFGLPAIALTGGHYLSVLVPADPAILAIALLLIATGTQLASPEAASRISAMVASAILFSLLLIVAVGLSGITPEMREARALTGPTIGFSQLSVPFMMIFFAFTGWEVSAGTSEEFRNPKRDFPLAMGLSFLAAMLLYFSMAVIVHFTPIESNYEAAFSSIMQHHLGVWGGILMSVLAVVIIVANLMGAIWAVSRMLLSLSRENVVPLDLSADETGRPLKAVFLVVGVLLAVLSLDLFNILAIEDMLSLAGQNFIILFAVAAGSLMTLTSSLFEKLVALVAVGSVAVLLAQQDAALLYPVLLSAAAGLLWAVQNRMNKTNIRNSPRSTS
ncbi:amino acid permease [Leisingera aquaemixtae]|uniref:APC family permease n=1 Tax=Leisingera aquaemixtae TaxID=1396826 RepID=UPI0021A6A265|nr:amino acid permease [Leisingera aquaemixtae]UWQ24100.1 amino acid permease [Leisingera aquaemixtae]